MAECGTLLNFEVESNAAMTTDAPTSQLSSLEKLPVELQNEIYKLCVVLDEPVNIARKLKKVYDISST